MAPLSDIHCFESRGGEERFVCSCGRTVELSLCRNASQHTRRLLLELELEHGDEIVRRNRGKHAACRVVLDVLVFNAGVLISPCLARYREPKHRTQWGREYDSDLLPIPREIEQWRKRHHSKRCIYICQIDVRPQRDGARKKGMIPPRKNADACTS